MSDCFIDETREASWETEGTFYSIVGVGPVLPQVLSEKSM